MEQYTQKTKYKLETSVGLCTMHVQRAFDKRLIYSDNFTDNRD